MLFDRLANAIQAHAKAIVILWVVILCVSGVFALKSGEVMSYDLNDMAPKDSESMEGQYIILEHFPIIDMGEGSAFYAVIYFEDQQQMEDAQGFVEYLGQAAASTEHINSVVGLAPMTSEAGDGIVMALIVTDYGKDAADHTPDVRAFIADAKATSGFQLDVYLTGSPAIGYDMEHNALEDVSRIDPFTVLMILILVGLFFRSFITSATPPLTIGAAFVVTMALIFGLGQIINIFFITNMMILVSMMGAGCDYCIFILARYREEMRSGRPHEDALHNAIVWAGESISISGAAVILGFGAISICSYSMISTMGICLALGILVALLAALTLIPSILALVGDRVFWPTKMDAYKEGGKATKGWYAACGRVGTGYFHKSARFSIKHAKAIAIVALLITVPAAYMFVNSEESYDMITSMQSGDSGEGMELLGEYGDQGFIMPNHTIVLYNEPLGTVYNSDDSIFGLMYWNEHWVRDVYPTLGVLYSELEKDDNIAYAEGPFVWSAMMELAEKEGVTDPYELEEFFMSHMSMKKSTTFSMLMDSLSASGITPDIFFTNLGMKVQQILGDLNIDIDWNAEVQESEAKGITDPDLIMEDIRQRFADTHNPVQTVIYDMIIGQMKESGVPSVIFVDGFGPFTDYMINVQCQFIGGDHPNRGVWDITYIDVSSATEEPAMSPRSMESIQYIVEVMDRYVADHSDIAERNWNTGSAVIMYDVSEEVKSQFTMIEVLVVIAMIILLLVVMRSYTIPLRSVLTILMSISWTLALTNIVFVQILGNDVIWLLPIILLVICLGLGMDYDILLTTRIRENVLHHGMSNDDAIIHAVEHTGSVITICGLIMGGAFGTLMMSSMTLLQEFGFTLCFAILIDALLVRTYIVPAVMHLLGDWNWIGPGSKFKRRPKEEQ
jgi:RND superfamily putative drug exporter